MADYADRYLAPLLRRLLDGIDQAVQVDRGLESRLAALAVADRLGEQRVHLTDIDRLRPAACRARRR